MERALCSASRSAISFDARLRSAVHAFLLLRARPPFGCPTLRSRSSSWRASRAEFSAASWLAALVKRLLVCSAACSAASLNTFVTRWSRASATCALLPPWRLAQRSRALALLGGALLRALLRLIQACTAGIGHFKQFPGCLSAPYIAAAATAADSHGRPGSTTPPHRHVPRGLLPSSRFPARDRTCRSSDVTFRIAAR